jgi:hypothetical protein
MKTILSRWLSNLNQVILKKPKSHSKIAMTGPMLLVKSLIISDYQKCTDILMLLIPVNIMQYDY